MSTNDLPLDEAALDEHDALDAAPKPTHAEELRAVFVESEARVRAAIEDAEKRVREVMAAVEREEGKR